MTPTALPQTIESRSNPAFKDLRRLVQDSAAYRKQGRIWVEGDHLGRAALQRGWRPRLAVFAHSAWPRFGAELGIGAERVLLLADELMASLSALASPAALGFVFDLPEPAPVQPQQPAVVLDRVQDAGNVGSIVRSAAAFGFAQVLALQGTAGLWSPKVLRAGMGAHFGLQLLEGLTLDEVLALQVPLLVTSSHQGQWLHQAELPWPCAWVLGHEGQGVDGRLMQASQHPVRIAQPGGEESLGVAAAAAICLHASAAGQLQKSVGI